MVLESLVNPLGAEARPAKMFLYGLLYSSVAVLLAIWIFKGHSSLVMVFLTTLACVPLMYNTMRIEEQKDETIIEERILLKEHGKALSFFIFLFLGVVVSLVGWYVFLPSGIANDLFSVQTETIASINSNVTGAAVQFSIFTKIFLNNVKVMIFCILFAFVYGVGAIFILTWNASVIGVAIGNFIRTNLSGVSTAVGLGAAGSYFRIFSLGLLKYSVHGIPEILAYFTAGLAAGIVSIAMTRHSLDAVKFRRVLRDSADLIIASVVLLAVAGLLEVYVTPVLFS
ncbi:MAG: stage II sporulation protein M [archaeon]